MSRPPSDDRPDANAVLDGLKPFQRDTVEYAFERLYRATDSSRRFLVADEVGLGKTLVARGVIAKAIDHLWEGDAQVDRIDVVYICTNAQIAGQNVRRLQLGSGAFVQAARLGLLPREIHRLKLNRVNYLALTPGTSFDLRSSMGTREERVVLYHLLQRVWPDRTKAPMNLLQGYVRNTPYFRWELRDFARRKRLDDELADAFKGRLEEVAGIRERYEDLCRRFRQARPTIPRHDRAPQIEFVGQLRSILAEVCVTALEPDLVILDEFQRFKGLLDGEGAAADLARRLFTYSDETSDVRLLLLSATPYRMYTLHHESAEDDHYRDFLRTVEFLEGETSSNGDLRALLDRYRQAMYRIESETTQLLQIKQRIETRLRRIMSRTERLGSSDGEPDGMLREVPSTRVELTAEDVSDFLALEKIGRHVEQPQILEYWKSAPYVLSFMDGYRLKTEVANRLPASSEDGLAQILTESPRVSLSWENVQDYTEVDPANARLRSLLDWMERSEAWRLLWLPPSLPYYTESDPWNRARREKLTKRLIFSTWQVVPKAIATLVSYDVERRVYKRFDRFSRNTPEERGRKGGLLQFAYSDDRLTGMPVLGLLYPSPSLVGAGDPVLARAEGNTLGEAVARAREGLEPALATFTQPYLDAPREDESWYWAAPILLDLERHRESTRHWFDRPDLASRWTGAEKDDDKGSRWSDHVEKAKKLVDDGIEAAIGGTLDFGRPPADLAEALAMRSVAGPATSALRALTRAIRPGTTAATAARDAAARIAWSFRKLFNLPEATALVRRERSADEHAPYWRQVLDYCAAGNLQAVLDEYVHALRDLEGLFAARDEEAWDRLAVAISAALSLRTGAPRVDEIRSADGATGIERHQMRNHFAMRFGAQESDDGKVAAHEGQVRQAFNSPFWPFVLASTSVGQEGLDFHVYCHAIMHWNLPSNPVDLEQREGRVHRYKGHAVRKNIAARHGPTVLRECPQDPWRSLFEAAAEDSSAHGGMVPYWLFPLEDGANIERHVPALPLSRDASQLEALKRSLAVYRMVFGQPRQDDLMAFLLDRCSPELLEEVGPLLRIHLSPGATDRT